VVVLCALLVFGLLGLNVASTIAGNRRDQRMAADRAVLSSAQVAYTVTNTNTGVVERWMSPSKDSEVIGSIRRATEELLLVRRNVGDFRIEGKKGVPGREELESNLDKLTFVRTEVDGGVELRTTTEDPELRVLLQQWSAELIR
jgi:hypothetical protein